MQFQPSLVWMGDIIRIEIVCVSEPYSIHRYVIVYVVYLQYPIIVKTTPGTDRTTDDL